MPTTAGSARLLTAEEFACLPCPADGSRQELVRGEVLTMPPPGFLHGLVQLNVAAILRAYVREHRLGRVTVEAGTVTQRQPDTVRAPDVAFWSFTTLPPEQTPDPYPDCPPDLVVEVRSPGDDLETLIEKAREYLAAGVRLVWVVDPARQAVTVFRPPDLSQMLTNADVISADPIMPGFSCAVAEFFRVE